MTKKQQALLEIINTYFNNKPFYFSELSQFGDFHPATLTSLCKLGLIEATQQKNKKLYLLKATELSEISKLQLEVKQLEGILTHLENSKENWKNQLEEVGIEFPEAQFQQWYEIVKERAEVKYHQSFNYLLSTDESAF